MQDPQARANHAKGGGPQLFFIQAWQRPGQHNLARVQNMRLGTGPHVARPEPQVWQASPGPTRAGPARRNRELYTGDGVLDCNRQDAPPAPRPSCCRCGTRWARKRARSRKRRGAPHSTCRQSPGPPRVGAAASRYVDCLRRGKWDTTHHVASQHSAPPLGVAPYMTRSGRRRSFGRCHSIGLAFGSDRFRPGLGSANGDRLKAWSPRATAAPRQPRLGPDR